MLNKANGNFVSASTLFAFMKHYKHHPLNRNPAAIHWIFMRLIHFWQFKTERDKRSLSPLFLFRIFIDSHCNVPNIKRDFSQSNANCNSIKCVRPIVTIHAKPIGILRHKWNVGRIVTWPLIDFVNITLYSNNGTLWRT